MGITLTYSFLLNFQETLKHIFKTLFILLSQLLILKKLNIFLSLLSGKPNP